MRRFSSWLLILVFLAACQTDGGVDLSPEVPTGVAAKAGDGQVTISWDASSESDLATYDVYRGTAAQALSARASVTVGTEELTDTEVVNGTTYFYALSAVDRGGNESARSAVVEATPTTGVVDDITAPQVVSSEPLAGSAGVAVNYHVAVAFSEAMQRAVTEGALTTVPAVSCVFEWNALSTRLTCHPQGGFTADTSYLVTVSSSATDLAGNGLATDHSFSFTTGTHELQACVFGEQMTFGGCVFGR